LVKGYGDNDNPISYYHIFERFLSEDPIGFASGDFNFYRYVGNGPVNLNDPSGENPLIALRIALSIITRLYKTIKNIRCTIRFSKADHY
jgi:hypothetical protein